MRRRRLGVRTALTIWYLAVLGLVIAAFSAALYWDQEQTLSAQVDRSLAGASGQVLALIDKHVDPIKFVDGDAYRHATSHLTQAGYAVLLFDPQRRLLERFGRTLQAPADIGATSLATIEAKVDGVEEPWRVSWQPVVRHDGVTVDELDGIDVLVDQRQHLARGAGERAVDLGRQGLLLVPVEGGGEGRDDQAEHQQVPGGQCRAHAEPPPTHAAPRGAVDSRSRAASR